MFEVADSIDAGRTRAGIVESDEVREAGRVHEGLGRLVQRTGR